MTKGILEGFIKPEVNIATDMSKETSDTHITYNQPVYITIDKLVITDKELGGKIVEMLCQHQQTIEVPKIEETP